jgi:putative Mg2+ transporter-C (MgtC) family protein
MEPWELTPWAELDAVLRLLIAAVVGGIIGYEREHAGKAAGLRTLVLVCIGAALFTVASIYGFDEPSDPSRIAAGVVVGVGFLGAGTILHGEGGIVAGLTTAATIWTVAAIGLAIGSGLYSVGVATAIIILVALRFPKVPRHPD